MFWLFGLWGANIFAKLKPPLEFIAFPKRFITFGCCVVCVWGWGWGWCGFGFLILFSCWLLLFYWLFGFGCVVCWLTAGCGLLNCCGLLDGWELFNKCCWLFADYCWLFDCCWLLGCLFIWLYMKFSKTLGLSSLI